MSNKTPTGRELRAQQQRTADMAMNPNLTGRIPKNKAHAWGPMSKAARHPMTQFILRGNGSGANHRHSAILDHNGKSIFSDQPTTKSQTPTPTGAKLQAKVNSGPGISRGQAEAIIAAKNKGGTVHATPHVAFPDDSIFSAFAPGNAMQSLKRSKNGGGVMAAGASAGGSMSLRSTGAAGFNNNTPDIGERNAASSPSWIKGDNDSNR